MHRLRSPGLLRGFRIASLLVFLKFVLLAVAIGIVIAAVIENDWRRVVLGFGVAASTVLLSLIRALFLAYIRCPLCMTPVFSPFGSVKHSKARKLLGSYRLRVALSILFRNWFTCPYCNEPTAMKLRPRPPQK